MEKRLSNYLETAVADFETAASTLIEKTRKETLDEVIEIIAQKQNQLDKILYNGRPIFEQALGDRFSKLYEQRQKLWAKNTILNSIYSKLCEMRYM